MKLTAGVSRTARAPSSTLAGPSDERKLSRGVKWNSNLNGVLPRSPPSLPSDTMMNGFAFHGCWCACNRVQGAEVVAPSDNK